MADWRRRMASDRGTLLYKERCKAGCPNAAARRMGLTRLLVGASKRPAPCCCGSRSLTTWIDTNSAAGGVVGIAATRRCFMPDHVTGAVRQAR